MRARGQRLRQRRRGLLGLLDLARPLDIIVAVCSATSPWSPPTRARGQRLRQRRRGLRGKCWPRRDGAPRSTNQLERSFLGWAADRRGERDLLERAGDGGGDVGEVGRRGDLTHVRPEQARDRERRAGRIGATDRSGERTRAVRARRGGLDGLERQSQRLHRRRRELKAAAQEAAKAS
jgi:hypothetical protein